MKRWKQNIRQTCSTKEIQHQSNILKHWSTPFYSKIQENTNFHGLKPPSATQGKKASSFGQPKEKFHAAATSQLQACCSRFLCTNLQPNETWPIQPYYQVLFSTHNIENTEFKHKRAYRKLEKNSALHGLVCSNHFYPNSQVQKQNGTIIQPPTIPNLIHTNTTCNHKKTWRQSNNFWMKTASRNANDKHNKAIFWNAHYMFRNRWGKREEWDTF